MAKKSIEQALIEIDDLKEQLLIQRKLASLGQLTAGIAHEIKNPLNFVNNFSEMNLELVTELEEEVLKNDSLSLEEKVEAGMEIIRMLQSNSTKISEHGRRADKIIQNMLLHSRAQSGEKTDTDIVEWVRENVDMAYTAMRKKTEFIPIHLETDYPDREIIVPLIKQDFGRVIINLVRNAVYTIQKKKNEGSDPDYIPTLSIRIEEGEERVNVFIKDNGNGIPRDILVRIWEPFFTTKPSGEGNTGLGLSISHDIVEKMHGGDLSVNSVVGEGTEFRIKMPK